MASEAIRARRDAEQRELGYQRAEREIAALRADLARAHFERDSAARDCVDAEAQCDGLRAEVAERTRERDDAIARHLKSDWCRERAEADARSYNADRGWMAVKIETLKRSRDTAYDERDEARKALEKWRGDARDAAFGTADGSARADAAEAKIATFVAQAKRIAGAHARDNDVHGEAAALYEAIAAAFTATASGPEGGDDAG